MLVLCGCGALGGIKGWRHEGFVSGGREGVGRLDYVLRWPTPCPPQTNPRITGAVLSSS